MAAPLTCKSCGGPLPPGKPGATVVCGYCGTAAQLPAPPPKRKPPRERKRRQARRPAKQARRWRLPNPLSCLPFLAIGAVVISTLLPELRKAGLEPRDLLPVAGEHLRELPGALRGYDGSAPFRCGGNERHTLRDLTLDFPGHPALIVEENCSVVLERVRIRAAVGIEARGNGTVGLEDVVVRSTGPALLVEGNKRVELAQTQLVSDGHALELSGNARVVAYSGLIEGAPRAVKRRRNGRLRVHDAEVVNRRRGVLPSEPLDPPVAPETEPQPPSIP